MRSLQVHGKVRPQVSFGPAFCPWPTNSVYEPYLCHWTLGLSLKDGSKSICHFNFVLNPVCKTCSWNLFEVSKNDLKKCVPEIAALLQSQGERESAHSGTIHSSPDPLCMHFTGPWAITILDLFAFFSPLFFTVKEFHQSAQPIRLDTVSWYR